MTSQEWPIATIFPSDVRSAASAVSSDPSASILRKGVKTTPHGVKVGSSRPAESYRASANCSLNTT